MSDSYISLAPPAGFSVDKIDVHWNPETGQHVAWLGDGARLHLTTPGAQALVAGLATSLDAERLGGAVTS